MDEGEKGFVGGGLERNGNEFAHVNAFDSLRFAAKPAAREEPGLKGAFELELMAVAKNFFPIVGDIEKWTSACAVALASSENQ